MNEVTLTNAQRDKLLIAVVRYCAKQLQGGATAEDVEGILEAAAMLADLLEPVTPTSPARPSRGKP